MFLGEQFGEGFGMFSAAFFFAWNGDDNPLRLGLADTGAGVGFYSFYGGEGLLFCAFLRHFVRAADTNTATSNPTADGVNLGLSYKLAPSLEGDVKYFHWKFFIGVWADGRTRVFR